MLMVEPYNAEVDLLKERLAEAGYLDAHVGTVDKMRMVNAFVRYREVGREWGAE